MTLVHWKRLSERFDKPCSHVIRYQGFYCSRPGALVVLEHCTRILKCGVVKVPLRPLRQRMAEHSCQDMNVTSIYAVRLSTPFTGSGWG